MERLCLEIFILSSSPLGYILSSLDVQHSEIIIPTRRLRLDFQLNGETQRRIQHSENKKGTKKDKLMNSTRQIIFSPELR